VGVFDMAIFSDPREISQGDGGDQYKENCKSGGETKADFDGTNQGTILHHQVLGPQVRTGLGSATDGVARKAQFIVYLQLFTTR
jgi:hypothetical protein